MEDGNDADAVAVGGRASAGSEGAGALVDDDAGAEESNGAAALVLLLPATAVVWAVRGALPDKLNDTASGTATGTREAAARDPMLPARPS